jgi:hypothetical protein
MIGEPSDLFQIIAEHLKCLQLHVYNILHHLELNIISGRRNDSGLVFRVVRSVTISA